MTSSLSNEMQIAKEYQERSIEFLTESSLLDNVKIDYFQADLQKVGKGYFGAFIDILNFAKRRLPITINELCLWQEWIVTEQSSLGCPIKEGIDSENLSANLEKEGLIGINHLKVPEKLKLLLDYLNKKLLKMNKYSKRKDFIVLLSNFYRKFDELQPYLQRNGRIIRLICVYIAEWFSIPWLIFRALEKPKLEDAISNKFATYCFIGNKLQEAVYNDEGKIFLFTENFGQSSSYTNSSSDKVCIVHWHSLQNQLNQWKRELDNSI